MSRCHDLPQSPPILPFTAPPHQSHTGRRSTSRRRVAASASWAWCPTLPMSHSAGSTNGRRCGYSPQQPPPTHTCSSFSSRISHLPFTIYYLPFLALRRCSGEQARSPIYHLRSSSSSTLSSSFITTQRYRISTNYARKILTKSRQITPYHAKKRQITPKKDKSRHITPKRASGSPVLRNFATC